MGWVHYRLDSATHMDRVFGVCQDKAKQAQARRNGRGNLALDAMDGMKGIKLH
jgi:hypothetical protein